MNSKEVRLQVGLREVLRVYICDIYSQNTLQREKAVMASKLQQVQGDFTACTQNCMMISIHRNHQEGEVHVVSRLQVFCWLRELCLH